MVNNVAFLFIQKYIHQNVPTSKTEVWKSYNCIIQHPNYRKVNLHKLSAQIRNSNQRFNCIILFVDGVANLSPRSNIVRKIDAGYGSYPSVNMCFYYLRLPDYPSKDVMREKLIMATNEKEFYLSQKILNQVNIKKFDSTSIGEIQYVDMCT